MTHEMDYKEWQLRHKILEIIDAEFDLLEYGGRAEPNIYRTETDPQELASKIVDAMLDDPSPLWNVIDKPE